MTMFRAFSGFACHGETVASNNREACTNGHSRLGIPILYFGQARGAEYQWIHFNENDLPGTEMELERAVQMNPESTLILGDEVNARMGAKDYAAAYVHWFNWLKERSPVTRLSTCGFEANHNPFVFAEEFIIEARKTVYVDEFRFNAAFAVSGDLGAFDSYLGQAQTFANSHGYRNKYCIGSFFSDPGLSADQLRKAMQLIHRQGTIKEAVYWSFESHTTAVHNPLAEYDGNQVPRLNLLGRTFAQTVRDIAEGTSI